MNKKEITDLIRNLASHFGERVTCEWLSPDGAEWIEWKNAEISVQFLMDLEKGYIRKIQMPQTKSIKVIITYEEYQAIQAGLSEIECTIGSGHLDEDGLESYKKYSNALNKLIDKIATQKNNRETK